MPFPMSKTRGFIFPFSFPSSLNDMSVSTGLANGALAGVRAQRVRQQALFEITEYELRFRQPLQCV